MKQNIGFLILGLALLGLGFDKGGVPEKKYSVTLSIDEWNGVMQAMNNSREIMKSSTLPANIVNLWTDSLGNVQAKMSFQIQAEMRKDGTLPSVKELEKNSVPIDEKKDSVKSKK